MQIPLSQRIDRLTRWLQRQNERPLVGFTLGSYYPLHRYRNGVRRIPNGAVHPEDIHVEAYLDETDDLFEMHAAAGGGPVWAAASRLCIPKTSMLRPTSTKPTISLRCMRRLAAT